MNKYKIIKIEPLENFRLFVEFSDGLKDSINMQKMLKHNDYKCINDFSEFQKISINKKGDIAWDCGAEMCKVATRNLLETMKDISNLKLPIGL